MNVLSSYIKGIFAAALLWTGMSAVCIAQTSKSVEMKVGEVKTFYLPSSVTSKRLKSVNFYATSPAYADVRSSTSTSVTIVAVKAFSSPVIVRCH